MKILITGVAGFVGFNFSNLLIKKTKYKIIGIDNINNYYSTKLKNDRIKNLSKNKNFFFKKIDIINKKKIEQLFKKEKFDAVFNFAAQAGVRYSIENPRSFVDNNIFGFYNIIECIKKYKIKKFFYASSSSVYGENKDFPLKETQKINPKNMYGLSKKINEEISKVYNANNFTSVGLRFFTLYGPWGRPDMFMIKYLEASFDKKKFFYLNNFGNHLRDFTYIDDACHGMLMLLKKKLKKENYIFNVSSNNPVNLKKVLRLIDSLTKKKPLIIKRELQEADIIKTHGDNTSFKNKTKQKKFTKLNIGIKNTINWYKNYFGYEKKK